MSLRILFVVSILAGIAIDTAYHSGAPQASAETAAPQAPAAPVDQPLTVAQAGDARN